MTRRNKSSRPLCWVCGRQLYFKPNVGLIYFVYTDPIGNKHKAHLECAEKEGFKGETIHETVGQKEIRSS
jgi:hypothetical protein